METLNDLMAEAQKNETYSKEEVLLLICRAHVAGINFQNKQPQKAKSNNG